MAISKEDILEAVAGMTVMDLNDLVKAFEEKFGVSAASLAVAAPGAAAAAPVEEKTEFDVVLLEAGATSTAAATASSGWRNFSVSSCSGSGQPSV